MKIDSGTLRLRDARGCVVCTPCETEHRAQARAMARGGGRPGVFVFRLEPHAALVDEHPPSRRPLRISLSTSRRVGSRVEPYQAYARYGLVQFIPVQGASARGVCSHVIWLHQRGGAIFDADLIKPRNKVSVGVVIRQLFASGNVPPRV